MFIQRHLIVFTITSFSCALATIYDEVRLSKNGPAGLITLKKNDTFIDWVRSPELNYKQWIFALKVWRTCSIVLGILCLIFAALVLTYIIHGFRTNSFNSFGCLGEVKSDNQLILNDENFQQSILNYALKRTQPPQHEVLRQKYEAERRLSAILRNPNSSALFTNQLALQSSLK